MPSHAATRRLACAAVLLLAAAPAAPAAIKDQAGLIFLKDGHVIKGYVLQPSESFVDPVTLESYTVHKGIFLVDDMCRRFFFSHAYVEKADYRPFDTGKEYAWTRRLSFVDAKSLPPIREVLEAGDWNDQWERTYRFRSPVREVRLTQHLSKLTPHYARVDANSFDPVTKTNNPYRWDSFYRTRELGPDTVRLLLSMHDTLKDKAGQTADERADRRLQVFNFLVSAGWTEEAEKELARIKRDFPGAKDKVETAAAGIKKLVALDRWDEIKVAHAAGRHESAKKLLAAFPADSADEQTLTEVRALKNRYDDADAAVKRAKELLGELPKRLVAADEQKVFTEAAAAIAAELTCDHFFKKADNDESRLARFLSQAEQAERLAKQDKPHAGPGELLSLAVTGWLLGGASAETKPEAARRVWRGRQFAREYQKTADPGARAALLKDYEGKSGLGVAEMAQLIAALPPPDPPEKVVTSAVEMKAPAVGVGKGTTYTLQLPPEYHPGRPYPVLIALYHGGEAGKDMVKRWGDFAAKYGYVLACPDWDLGVSGVYSYTADEHAAVLDTLRDLRQHFRVDSDRVFLTGFGEGGNMAWDVGLAHPDLFAGVVPVCGQPRYHALRYWANALDLPFYVVWGEQMGGPTADKKGSANLVNFNMFKENWIPGGYPYYFPAVGVQYKGRGLEWFPAEVPDVFDWMAHKRRRHPADHVGVIGLAKPDDCEYRTMRAGDNRFYWLSVAGISDKRLNEGRWDPKVKPALVAGRIASGNSIAVEAVGVGQVSVWLARGMIDFDKPVTVRVNNDIKWNNAAVKPKLATLLEDFWERGDRQRLYVARIDLMKP